MAGAFFVNVELRRECNFHFIKINPKWHSFSRFHVQQDQTAADTTALLMHRHRATRLHTADTANVHLTHCFQDHAPD